MMLDTEATSTRTGWRPRVPGRRKVVGHPGESSPGPATNGAGRRRRPARRDGGEGQGGYDIRNSWQVVAGSLLIPLGVVFILLAWYGAAHGKVDQQQIPYLISGGLVGLGCMVLGGLLYWGHWLYRIFDQADLHHQEQQELLEQLIRALGAQPVRSSENGGSATAPESWPPPSAGEASGAGPDERYYATANGTVYHRAGCAVIAHHPTDLRVLGRGGLAGLRPCQICAPE